MTKYRLDACQYSKVGTAVEEDDPVEVHPSHQHVCKNSTYEYHFRTGLITYMLASESQYPWLPGDSTRAVPMA